MPKRSRLLIFMLLFLIHPIHFNANARVHYKKDISLEQFDNVIPGVIIIKFSEDFQITKNTITSSNLELNKRLKNVGILSLKRLINNSSQDLRKSLPSAIKNIYTASIQNENSPIKMARTVSAWPEVIYAEPRYFHYLCELPNDTLFTYQSEYYQLIEAPEAWNEVKGEQGEVIIAIVDGGTDIRHTDLRDNIWQNQVEVDGNSGEDDDGNGYIDDLYGWNFVNQSGDPTGIPTTPGNANHGTQTAGIASAVTNNVNGVSGTSWNSTIMGINASDDLSDRSIAYGMEGIIYAAENGADIISCSWGRLGGYSHFEQDVINYATSLGSIVIAAAGNNNSNLSHYPSSFDNVLSIAGTTVHDEKYISSNYGPHIDLAAPAVNIYSTMTENTYGFASGTSMSAPMVSGTASLVKTIHPEWSGLQIGEQVRVTADSLPDEVGQLGRGRLNVLRAVTESLPSIRLIDYEFEDENGNGTIEPGERVNGFITIRNYLQTATDVKLVLTSDDPYVTISQSDMDISSIATMEQIHPETPFLCDIAENTPSDHAIEFILNISSNEYEDVDYLTLTVLPGYLDLSINNIKMTITSIGRLGNPDPFEDTRSVGFTYKLTDNLLYEGAIISGISESQISNAARAGSGDYDQDFIVTSGGDIRSQIPGTLSDEESFGQFIDQDAVEPMGIEISQYSYALKDTANDDYIIIVFVIQNLNPNDLNDFHFGLFFDWDIDGESYDTNVIRYDSERNMGIAFDTGNGEKTTIGVVSLSDEEMNFEAIYNDDLGVFTLQKKWMTISRGIVAENAGPADVSFVIANGPMTIPAYSNHRLAFALVAGDDSLSLFKHADSAIAMWDKLMILDIGPKEVPQVPFSYGLSQNYPNPFNPQTIINYELPITNFVELSIYNLLGQKEVTLVSERQSAGVHQLEWDAGNLASGVYYYVLRASNFRAVKKMVLLK